MSAHSAKRIVSSDGIAAAVPCSKPAGMTDYAMTCIVVTSHIAKPVMADGKTVMPEGKVMMCKGKAMMAKRMRDATSREPVNGKSVDRWTLHTATVDRQPMEASATTDATNSSATNCVNASTAAAVETSTASTASTAAAASR